MLDPGPTHFLSKEFCVCHFVYRLHFFMQIYTQILPPYTTHEGLANAEIDKEQLCYKYTVLQQINCSISTLENILQASTS